MRTGFARHFDAAHYTKLVTANEALEALPQIVAAYEEPFGNNSAIGTGIMLDYHRVGLVVLYISMGASLFSGGQYLRHFFHAVLRQPRTST